MQMSAVEGRDARMQVAHAGTVKLGRYLIHAGS